MLSTTYGISLLHQSRVVKIGYAIFGVSECECTTTWVVDRVWAHVHLFICGSKRLDAFLDQDFPWGSSARLIHEHMLRKWVSDWVSGCAVCIAETLIWNVMWTRKGKAQGRIVDCHCLLVVGSKRWIIVICHYFVVVGPKRCQHRCSISASFGGLDLLHGSFGS